MDQFCGSTFWVSLYYNHYIVVEQQKVIKCIFFKIILCIYAKKSECDNLKIFEKIISIVYFNKYVYQQHHDGPDIRLKNILIKY